MFSQPITIRNLKTLITGGTQMRPINSTSSWFAAAVCVLATTGVAAAQEGVVRLSDADSSPAVIKMNGGQQKTNATVQTAFGPGGAMANSRYGSVSPQQHFAAYAKYYGLEPVVQEGMGANVQQASYGQPASYGYGQAMGGYGQSAFASPYMTDMYSSGDCYGGCDTCQETGNCGTEGCSTSGCNSSGCNTCDRGRGNRRGNKACEDCDDCYYGDGYNRRVRLLAGALPKGSCNDAGYPTRWWRGQSSNFSSRNQRLSNCLFGWMVPSGCCGQGCPPFGKYHVTYADEPDYADSRDGQAYGVQGYGIPMTVPLAPNVHQSYNYSWGTPSSRLTPIGHYDPKTSPQALPHQTW